MESDKRRPNRLYQSHFLLAAVRMEQRRTHYEEHG